MQGAAYTLLSLQLQDIQLPLLASKGANTHVHMISHKYTILKINIKWMDFLKTNIFDAGLNSTVGW